MTGFAIPRWTIGLLAATLFALQGGYYAFNGTLALALASAGAPDQQVGLVVGFAPLMQIPAAVFAGALIDRFGGSRLILVAALCYAMAAIGFVAIPLGEEIPVGSMLFLRTLQGIGLAIVLPAALSMVPLIARSGSISVATALVASSHNLTLVLIPPIAFTLLRSGSLSLVGVLALACAAGGGFLLGWVIRPIWSRPSASPALRFRFQRRWRRLLISNLLTTVAWGGLVAFLPQRASADGADVAIFFVADAAAVLAIRLPTGWMLDRLDARFTIALGIVASGMGLALLTQPASDLLLGLAGAAFGIGAGLQVTSMLVVMGRRSSDRDRGTAFALFSMSLAAGQAVGAIGGGQLMSIGGFDAVLFAGFGAMMLALVIAWKDSDDTPHSSPIRADDVFATAPSVSAVHPRGVERNEMRSRITHLETARRGWRGTSVPI